MDQERKAEERTDALLLEGLDSGQPITATPEYWRLLARDPRVIGATPNESTT